MTGRTRHVATAALAAAALAGGSLLFTHHARAEAQAPAGAPAEPRGARLSQRPLPPGAPERPGFPGQPGRFPGGMPMPPMGMGAPVSMTATASTVYVLRGNTLYAFDAKTLRLTGQAELPAPQFPGGPGGPGGPGRPVPPGFGQPGDR